MRAAVVLTVVAGLPGCTAGSAVLDNATSDPPPDFRALITRNLESTEQAIEPSRGAAGGPAEQQMFPASIRVDAVTVADVTRRVHTNIHGWAWQTCTRVNINGVRRTFAVFAENERVIDARGAVAIDQCEKGNYSPLKVDRPASDLKKG